MILKRRGGESPLLYLNSQQTIMLDKQIDILIKVFKEENVKKAFLKEQYSMPDKVGSLILAKKEAQIQKTLEKWIKQEDSINKKWKENLEPSLVKVLIQNKISPAFPNNYNLDTVSWAIRKGHVLYENIMFVETNNGPKLMSDLDKVQLASLSKLGSYVERQAIDRLLNKAV